MTVCLDTHTHRDTQTVMLKLRVSVREVKLQMFPDVMVWNSGELWRQKELL